MKKILIIDDGSGYTQAISEILKKAGYQVLERNTPEEIFSKKTTKFDADVILLDHDLGRGITGKIVVEELLKVSAGQLISISSGSFDVSYCAQHWWYKEDLIFPEQVPEKHRNRATETLIEMIKGVEKTILTT